MVAQQEEFFLKLSSSCTGLWINLLGGQLWLSAHPIEQFMQTTHGCPHFLISAYFSLGTWQKMAEAVSTAVSRFRFPRNALM